MDPINVMLTRTLTFVKQHLSRMCTIYVRLPFASCDVTAEFTNKTWDGYI